MHILAFCNIKHDTMIFSMDEKLLKNNIVQYEYFILLVVLGSFRDTGSFLHIYCGWSSTVLCICTRGSSLYRESPAPPSSSSNASNTTKIKFKMCLLRIERKTSDTAVQPVNHQVTRYFLQLQDEAFYNTIMALCLLSALCVSTVM